jgi:hypothetical protein
VVVADSLTLPDLLAGWSSNFWRLKLAIDETASRCG